MKPLIVIPARGGSKGVPKKNIKPLNGKPLIHYTIEAALTVFDKEYICVSTDAEEISSVAEEKGINIPFLRPPHLAADHAGTYEVLLHAIQFYEEQKHYSPDTLILLQPTSPFRNASHIQEALQAYDEDCDMVVSVKETKANPYYLLKEEDENGYLISSKTGNFIRRQDCPSVYELNGAIYIIRIATLKKMPLHEIKRAKKYLMDETSSHDIDTILDWQIAETILKNFNFQP
ncbi:MAG: acylneuraminate cytidylyltransferase family protein [Chitinophagales bacterium]|nr:acylneuraminate cytidylyltransferase family protein [Chitinophagales bacterium]